MALVTARSAPVEPRQLQVLRKQREKEAARLADELVVDTTGENGTNTDRAEEAATPSPRPSSL